MQEAGKLVRGSYLTGPLCFYQDARGVNEIAHVRPKHRRYTESGRFERIMPIDTWEKTPPNDGDIGQSEEARLLAHGIENEYTFARGTSALPDLRASNKGFTGKGRGNLV